MFYCGVSSKGAGIKIRFDITLGAGEEVDEVAGGASGMAE
jgi:hypothetical protein